MSKKSSPVKAIEVKSYPLPIVDPTSLTDIVVTPIDCIARSAQCYMNQGHNNFKILTLTIKAGVVVDVKYSDAYLIWEAISRSEIMNDKALNNLNMHWKDGKCLQQ